MTGNREKLAKIIRMVSVPPVMFTAFVLILYYLKPSCFQGLTDILMMILFLGIVPVAAYPLQKILPGFRKMGREGQRKLAFVFSLIGYTIAFVWALVVKAGKEITLICATYFVSVVLLTICNKALHFKASGHACSITGPLLLLIFFVGWKTVFPCLLLAVVIAWSSLVLKRHTAKELTGGALTCLTAFVISLVLIY